MSRLRALPLAAALVALALALPACSAKVNSTAWAALEDNLSVSFAGNLTCCERLAAINFTSNLPIVIFDTGDEAVGNHEATAARVCLCPNGWDFKAYDGYAEVSIRGSSSSKFAKSQYKLKLVDSTEKHKKNKFKWMGMPKDDSWVMYGDDMDDMTAGMRDWMAYNTARASGRYAPRTVWSELFVISDGEPLNYTQHYRGLYIGEEPISRGKNRVNVTKWNETHPSGGYIFLSDHSHYTDSDYVTDVLPGMEYPFILKYPKSKSDGEAAAEWLSAYLKEAQSALEDDATWLDDAAAGGYREYFDVPSFIDFQLLVEFTKSPDGYRDSTYLHKDVDQPINAGPVWDFNEAFGECCGFPIQGYEQNGKSGPGIAGGSAISTDGWRFMICLDQDRCVADPTDGISFIFQRMWNDTAYRVQASERWAELRAGNWSNDAILGMFDDAVSLVRDAALRDQEHWAYTNLRSWYSTPAEQWETEIDDMRTWIEERLAWMDKALAYAGSADYVYPGTGSLLDDVQAPSAESPARK